MLVRLFSGPLSGLDREVPDGAEVYEVPFVSVPGGTREVGYDTEPTGYWQYAFTGAKWVFAGIKHSPSFERAKAKELEKYFQVDEPGPYVLDNGDVIDILRDESGVYYGLYKGVLCTLQPVPEVRGVRVVTVKDYSVYGVIVDKGEWGPASIDDLKRAPVAALFGGTSTSGTLVGARFKDGVWLWISSDGYEVDTCQTVKCLSELPF